MEPSKTFGMPAPAALSCESVGGQYKIITDANGGQSGVCNYPLGFKCSDLQYYKEGGCTVQNLVSGALHFWPVTFIILFVVFTIVYSLTKKTRT